MHQNAGVVLINYSWEGTAHLHTIPHWERKYPLPHCTPQTSPDLLLASLSTAHHPSAGNWHSCAERSLTQ